MKKDFTSTNCESSDCFADAEPSVARRLYRHVLRTTSHKQGPFGDCRLNTVVVGPQFVAGQIPQMHSRFLGRSGFRAFNLMYIWVLRTHGSDPVRVQGALTPYSLWPLPEWPRDPRGH